MFRSARRLLVLAASLTLLLSACSEPAGLRRTPDGEGPRVVIDWDADPLPEIPFPNDLATRQDPTSPTGLRLNFSEMAPTQSERDLRVRANELSGFGIYAPVMVAFEAPLDLPSVLSRHGIGDVDFSDDAVYVIDVTPGSPTYLQPAELDLGGGRFPIDLPSTGDFWTNDPRADAATLMFETVDEDLNGNGELDPGEDTDNDGVLDAPNTLPAGSPDRMDLIEWYERETDTLMFRPVVPLREETTYAVVLTDRLVDEGGEPVRSPWEFVHHVRQTEALRPAVEALGALGLSIENMAFGWTFTTASVTGDLLAVRNGLDGEGPFARLAADFPATVTETTPMQEAIEDRKTHLLPISRMIGPLVTAGALPGGAEGLIASSYLEYGGNMMTGVFTTPFFMPDGDDGGFDNSDESWRIDRDSGDMDVEAQRVPFTCMTPAPSPGHEAPFPVVMLGHGQGGTRFHLVVLAWAFNRMGLAACAFDFPGHGGALPPDQEAKYAEILDALGLLPAFRSFADARHRDLDNDGLPDSGADFWVADPFHTRDNVRQAAVDFMQFARVLRNCGTGTMAHVDGRGQVVNESVTCDWDEDGVPDVGGPDKDILVFGASLGGINSSVAAAMEPLIQAAVPMIPGGGLGDGLLRSSLGGPREAVIGRLLTPLVVGVPGDDGTISVEQLVISANNTRQFPIATLPSVPAGGSIRVENLDNGEVRDGWIPEDGRFRVSFPADAMSGGEKRAATGMPETGPALGSVYSVVDNEGLGDRFRVTVRDADGAEVAVIDRFETEVVHEGVTMAAGSPLVAGGHGAGHIRQTPRLRRLVQILAMVGEPGDPIAHSPRWFHRPLNGERPRNVLMMPTIGDDVVPIATGIALARSAGMFSRRVVAPQYEMPVDQWLIERGVVHGYEEFGPYTDSEGRPVLFDPDDLDDGLDGAPSEAPLRATVQTASGVSGLRIVYSNPRGSHGWGIPESSGEFDINTFATMQAAWYLASGGQELSDDPCLGRGDCSWFRVK